MADQEDDELHDETDVDPQQLIDDLKYSRHMVVVAERSMKNFDDNLSHSRTLHSTEVGNLQDKRMQEEHIINSSKNGSNDFIFSMFVRHGRPQEEARGFIHSTPEKIKAALRRKILLKRRSLDLVTYHKTKAKQIVKENNTKRKISNSTKTSGTDIIFRTKFPNYSMKRIARKTFDNAKGITNLATHIELIGDVAGKLAAVDGYLKEDATNFQKTLKDLSLRIKEQEKEIWYLSSILHEGDRAFHRAEKIFFNSTGALEEAELTKKEMLKDLQEAMKEHRELCRRCTRNLVGLNENIQRTSGGSLVRHEPSIVKKFPHMMSSAEREEQNSKGGRTSKLQTNELQRASEALCMATKAGSPEEVLRYIRDQVSKAATLQSQIERVSHILSTVLRPEQMVFHTEHKTTEAKLAGRAAAAEKVIETLQDNYDKNIGGVRALLVDQADNAQDLENFVQALQAMNKRVAQTFNMFEEDEQYLESHPSIEGLLELTRMNIEIVSEKLPDFFAKADWEKLSQMIEDEKFLEYRSTKLPASNNRVTFDSASTETSEEHKLQPKPQCQQNFITKAQLKAANEQIMEHARLAELARLKESNQAAEKEHPHPKAKNVKSKK